MGNVITNDHSKKGVVSMSLSLPFVSLPVPLGFSATSEFTN